MPEVLSGTPTNSHNKANIAMMNNVRLSNISPTLSMNGSSNEASNCKYTLSEPINKLLVL